MSTLNIPYKAITEVGSERPVDSIANVLYGMFNELSSGMRLKHSLQL
jgi:hypothetical protein